MRRVALVATLAGVLALAAPAAALARGHHHRHHHARSHKAARTLIFTPTSGDTHTSTPVTSTTSEPPHAAMVASFSGGVLTLALNDGSTVKGLVTEQTDIVCAPASDFAAHAADAGEGQSGDDGSSQTSRDDGNEDENAETHEQDDEGTEAGACGTSALAPPALVREAELSIGPQGAVFERIVLVH
jgi:hypothetical protein